LKIIIYYHPTSEIDGGARTGINWNYCHFIPHRVSFLKRNEIENPSVEIELNERLAQVMKIYLKLNLMNSHKMHPVPIFKNTPLTFNKIL